MSKPRRTLTTDADIRTAGAKQIAIRVSLDLNEQLEIIARRECNGVSAVCRRLISRGLREELQSNNGEAA